jgi:sortase A
MDQLTRNKNKQQEGRRTQRQRAQKKRRRMGLFVFIGLVVLVFGALIFFGVDRTINSVLQGDVEGVEQVEDPTGDEVPELFEEESDESEDVETGEEEEAAEEDEAAPIPPDDPTMYLNIPKLNIAGAIVADGDAGLELGAMHLPGTGFPWQPGSNTYIAGHRIGFPGTGSDRIFYDLPALTEGDEVTLYDSLGQEYSYRVSEVFAVTPFDLWVADPTGSDVLTLQVCTETPDDWWTIGPGLMSSGPESGRLIVRAEPV